MFGLANAPSVAAQDSVDLLQMTCAAYAADGAQGQLLTVAILRGYFAQRDEFSTFAVWRTREYASRYASRCKEVPDQKVADVIKEGMNWLEPMVAGALYTVRARCTNLDPGVTDDVLLVIGGHYYGYVKGPDAATLPLDGGVIDRMTGLIASCRSNNQQVLLDLAKAAYAN
jgi:hypothetical protein